MSLTIPSGLTADGATVFPEVQGEAFRGMFLESSGDKVPAQTGVGLRLAPKAGQHVDISLVAADGRTLCTWRPAIHMWPHKLAPLAEGFSSLEWSAERRPKHYYTVRDPIEVGVGGRLAEEAAEFRIDGEPARVLARSPRNVILRAAHLEPGLHILSSQGYAVTLAFVDVHLEVPSQRAGGKGAVIITVLGLGEVKPPRWPASVFLYNLNAETITLESGKLFPNDPDWDAARLIRLTSASGGSFRAMCKVRFRQAGAVNLDVRLFAMPPHDPPVPFLPPVRR